MSLDFQCSTSACDHHQLMERYSVDVFDFRTLHYVSQPNLNMRAPINAPNQVQVYVHGKLVPRNHPYWGYSIVPDPARIQDNYTFSKIQFNNPVREVGALIEVCYFTREGLCLKCAATGYLADWQISPSGSLNVVAGTDKLAQQCDKYIRTSKNPFNPDLVCPLKGYIGTEFGVSFTDDDVSSDIVTILSRYQSIQAAQRTIQSLDSTEVLKDILSVVSTQDTSDPTTINVQTIVEGYGSGDPIPLSLTLSGSGS